MIKVGTLCVSWQACLLIIVGTHVCCLLRDRKKTALFLSCTRRLRARFVPRWENPWFSVRYASQVLQIRLQYLNPGNYRAFSPIQSCTITLAHSDEPRMRNSGEFMETPSPLQYLERESKMRILQTHSHTSERQGTSKKR